MIIAPIQPTTMILTVDDIRIRLLHNKPSLRYMIRETWMLKIDLLRCIREPNVVLNVM